MEFINRELQDLDAKDATIKSTHLKKLDDISHDIKILDNLLDKYGFLKNFINNISQLDKYGILENFINNISQKELK